MFEMNMKSPLTWFTIISLYSFHMQPNGNIKPGHMLFTGLFPISLWKLNNDFYMIFMQ